MISRKNLQMKEQEKEMIKETGTQQKGLWQNKE